LTYLVVECKAYLCHVALLHGSAGAWFKLCFPCEGTQDKPVGGEQVDGARAERFERRLHSRNTWKP